MRLRSVPLLGLSAALSLGVLGGPAAPATALAAPLPPGVNDWNCRPTAARPRPVVLLHGTFSDAAKSWSRLSPALKADGHCVFALNYGAPEFSPIKAVGHIPDSARELAAFVDRVLARTGAAEVDLVGHSQGGGVMPRWYLKFEGGAAKVAALIGIAPSNHGTTLHGLATQARAAGLLDTAALRLLPAVAEQVTGSQVHTTLDRGGDTVPGVRYVTIVSRYDEVITPYRNQYLTAGPGAVVQNITLQQVCPIDFATHIAMTHDPITLRLVRNALDPARAVTPQCRFVSPLAGGDAR